MTDRLDTPHDEITEAPPDEWLPDHLERGARRDRRSSPEPLRTRVRPVVGDAGRIGESSAARRSGRSDRGRPTASCATSSPSSRWSSRPRSCAMSSTSTRSPSKDLVFDDTTPTGGDFGAHVWGPGVPPRPPAAVVPAQRLDDGLVRGHAGVPLLHGAAGAGDRARQRRAALRRGDEARQRPRY